MTPNNAVNDTSVPRRRLTIWPFLLIGFIVCVVLAGISFFEPLVCISDSQSRALARWCQAGTAFPTVERLLALSCLGLILGCVPGRLPALSPWAERLQAVGWVSVSAGVIGELILVTSVPS